MPPEIDLGHLGHLGNLPRHNCSDSYVPYMRSLLSGDKLIEKIESAVDPQNYEPNLALNLEVADLINSKKGNA